MPTTQCEDADKYICISHVSERHTVECEHRRSMVLLSLRASEQVLQVQCASAGITMSDCVYSYSSVAPLPLPSLHVLTHHSTALWGCTLQREREREGSEGKK